MGRHARDFKPLITEENRALAQEFLDIMSRHYEEYLKLFSRIYDNGEDIVGESLLKAHRSILNNGLPSVRDKEGEEREQHFKNYFFISAKLNGITEQQNIQKRRQLSSMDFNPFEDMATDEKIALQIYRDYKIMYIIDMVEKNFDMTDYRLFRLYHLLKGMTYQKLSSMTGIKNCKTRVVKINKWLRDNIDEREIRESFIREYPDLA